MELLTQKEETVAHFKSVPMKKVLIAVDYDTNAQHVAEVGYALAVAMKAEVTLLHVIADKNYYGTLEMTPLAGFSGFTNADFLQVANVEGMIKAGQYFLEKIKHHFHDKTINTVVKEGDFSETILKTAHETHANIIVMGVHHKQWLEKVLFGSVAEDVFHHATIPMLIVPIKAA